MPESCAQTTKRKGTALMSQSDLVVFSHLRWDFVYQRPQHLLSRMAARRRVLFIEESVFDPAGPNWEVVDRAPNVRVARLHSPIETGAFCEDEVPIFQRLVPELLEAEA